MSRALSPGCPGNVPGLPSAGAHRSGPLRPGDGGSPRGPKVTILGIRLARRMHRTCLMTVTTAASRSSTWWATTGGPIMDMQDLGILIARTGINNTVIFGVAALTMVH